MLCVGLGFHVVIGVGLLVVRFHHAFVIPSFLLDVVVRLYLLIVNSDCSHNYCMLHIAVNIIENIEHSWPQRCVSKNKTIRSHKSRAGIPSYLNPASKEMISDSVELCETEVCF